METDKLSERLQTPISTAELERRWTAVRAAMEQEKIDVLLMQNNNDHMGGYVKYFTDLPATNGYPLTVVFPRDDLMTLVSTGPFGGVTTPATVMGSAAVSSSGSQRRASRHVITPPSTIPNSLRKRSPPMPAARLASSALIRCRSRWSIICAEAVSPILASSKPPIWSTASRSLIL
jgi:hypothetical protein